MSLIKKPSINVRGSQVTASGTLDPSGGTGAFSISAGPNGISGDFSFREKLNRRVQSNRVRGPLAKLYRPNAGKTFRPIVFPLDLDDEHYMIFNVIKRRRPSQKNEGTTRIFRSIILPIPANLQTQYQAGYDNTSLGPLGVLAQGGLGGAELRGAMGSLSDFVSQKAEAASQAFKTDQSDAFTKLGAVATAGATLSSAVGALGPLGVIVGANPVESVVTGLMQNEGISINPHMAVVFRGVDFRTHQFQYKFIARNQEESDSLKEMINAFKTHMLPSYMFGTERAGFAFKYPDEFTVDFSDKIKDYLYKIGTSVMTDLQVSYNGEGVPTFFEQTGAPVSIDITFSLQETRIVTREDFDEVDENSFLEVAN